MFQDALKCEAMPGGRWQLLTTLTYKSATRMVTVPAGFVTDLASIPRALQWLPHFGVNGRSRRPAVMHDWLYAQLGPKDPTDKAYADTLFREALAAEGLNRVTCALYYYAVHFFGKP